MSFSDERLAERNTSGYQAVRTVTMAKLFDRQHSVADAPAG